jgi:uncharacterized protein YdeI (BOF family)
MKKIISILVLILVSTNLQAQAPKISAKKGTNFGEKMIIDGATPIDSIAVLLKENNPAQVKVIGIATDVCETRGCFLYLQTSSGKIYVKTKDDSFFVPTKLNGKKIIVKGTAERNSDSKEISIQATGIIVI